MDVFSDGGAGNRAAARYRDWYGGTVKLTLSGQVPPARDFAESGQYWRARKDSNLRPPDCEDL